MTDILQEVLNEQKDEKKLILFRKAFPIIIGATMIIAIFIGIYNWRINKNIEHNRKIGDMFIELSSNKNLDNNTSISQFADLLKISDNKQSELVELKIAIEYISDKKTDSAIQKLVTIIDNKNYDKITLSFARLLLVSIILDKNKISDEDQTKLENYFQYFNNKDQPFFATATLMKALMYKKNNQNDLATKYVNILLKLNNAPLILKEQGKAILANIEFYQN